MMVVKEWGTLRNRRIPVWIQFVSEDKGDVAVKGHPEQPCWWKRSFPMGAEERSLDVNLRKVPGISSVYRPLADQWSRITFLKSEENVKMSRC